MNQSLGKMGVRLFLVFGTPIFLLSVLVMNCFPEHFTIGIYGLLEAQRDYAREDHTDNRVLIMGDSIAQVAYMPSLLSDDTYNYGIGNETPVDGYYRLLEYLENHADPEYLICSYNPVEFIQQGAIWSTTLYERGISLDIARAIARDARNYSDDSGVYREYGEFQALAYTYGFHVDSVIMMLKGAVKNLTDESCYEKYRNMYDWVVEHRGQWKHYMAGGTGSDINDTVQGAFSVTDIADHYMREIIELCEERGIGLIVETVPINRSSYAEMNPEFAAAYDAYWSGLAREYPDIVVNSETVCYDDSYFVDSLHFSGEGTEKFSNHIREKYDYVFEGGQI